MKWSIRFSLSKAIDPAPPPPPTHTPPPPPPPHWHISLDTNPLTSSKDCSSTSSEMCIRGKSVRSCCDGSSDRSFMVDPLSYFSFQPVIHDWCNKGRGVCYPVCGKVYIKEPLLLINGKSSPCCGSGFPFSISEWSFTICLTPYNRK